MKVKLNIFKLLIGLFLYLYIYLRVRQWYFKLNKKNPPKKPISEIKRYKFINTYSRILLWFYCFKHKVIDDKIWTFHSATIISNSNNLLIPLLVLKINNFKKHTPISFLFSRQFIDQLPKILKYFYLSLNYFVFDESTDLNSQFEKFNFKIVKNILIPRTMLIMSADFKNPDLSYYYGRLVISSLSKMYFLKVQNHNFQFKLLLNRDKIIKMNSKVLYNKIDILLKK